jgi:uncharacterized membrane protein
LRKTVSIYKSISTPQEKEIQNISQSYAAEDEELEEVTLTDEEIEFLKLLIKKDGQAVDISDIKYKLSYPKLQADQIIESLSNLGLVRAHNNYMHGLQVNLTREGRDYVLGNKYSRT